MTKTTYVLGALASVAVLAAGGLWLARSAGLEALSIAALAETADDATILPDVVMGQEDAPVTVIEYASYTCPHCAVWHKEVLPPLKADYIDTGKVKFIHREVYFDRYGLMAGTVASCGGVPKYYAISGMIYDTQSDWIGDGKEATIGANLRKIGLKAGLSAEAVNACLSDNDRAQAMVATFQKHATDDAIDSTPTILVNGEKYPNMSYADLKAIIDAKLAE
ncbi:DsbA family protein [Phaeovulum sp.]|uniref:DsbA family protein n=1 Tax=Phaeovulum sp. TaxID=2934796 RepID=UPI0039E40C96